MKKKYVAIFAPVLLVLIGGLVYILVTGGENKGDKTIDLGNIPHDKKHDPKEDLEILRKPNNESYKITRSASRLREGARKDPVFFDQLCSLVTDEKEKQFVREIIACVLGTFNNKKSQGILLDLFKSTKDKKMIATVALALFLDKDWRTDEVFHLKNAPNSFKSPQGLYVVLKEQPLLADLQSDLLKYLKDPDSADLRRSSASVLTFNIGQDDVRKAFLECIGAESDEDGKIVISISLCSWAVDQTLESGDRTTIVSFFLTEAASEKNIALCLRIEGFLNKIKMTKEEVAKLISLATGKFETTIKLFSLRVLKSKANNEVEKLVIDGLDPLARDENTQIREHYFHVISQIKSRQVWAKLCNAIDSDKEDEIIKIAAIIGLRNQKLDPDMDGLRLNTIISMKDKYSAKLIEEAKATLDYLKKSQ